MTSRIRRLIKASPDRIFLPAPIWMQQSIPFFGGWQASIGQWKSTQPQAPSAVPSDCIRLG